MTPKQKHNLERLFNPRHVAVIGGRDAAVPIGECDRIGFAGEIWPVNPKRETLGGRRCFASVADLPEAPDAVFVAVPASAAPDVVRQLADRGAGGAVCYTAGFGEAGNEAAEAALVEAAGEMALVGPNCYGLINYVDKVALWPFAHGGACPGHEIQRPHPEVPAQAGLEGRSSARHPSFEAPLRSAPQDEEENNENRGALGPFNDLIRF